MCGPIKIDSKRVSCRIYLKVVEFPRVSMWILRDFKRACVNPSCHRRDYHKSFVTVRESWQCLVGSLISAISIYLDDGVMSLIWYILSMKSMNLHKISVRGKREYWFFFQLVKVLRMSRSVAFCYWILYYSIKVPRGQVCKIKMKVNTIKYD